MNHPELANTTACYAVLTLPELAELIFMRLPMRDVLTRAQLICRQWHDTIASSAPIQQALFFRPLQPKARAATNNTVSIHNKHLDNVDTLPPMLHPTLGAVPHSIQASPRFKEPSASWRRCLVTQPSASGQTFADCIEALLDTREWTISPARLANLTSNGSIFGLREDWRGWRRCGLDDTLMEVRYRMLGHQARGSYPWRCGVDAGADTTGAA